MNKAHKACSSICILRIPGDCQKFIVHLIIDYKGRYNFEEERNRLTNYFRNNGVYNFQQNYINFDVDTIKTGNKANVDLLISDYSYRDGDTLATTPFKIYKISLF